MSTCIDQGSLRSTEEAIKEYKRSIEEEEQLGKETAARFDSGKLRYDLIPPYVLDELAKIYTYGAKKYHPDNYLKGMDWRKVLGPALRHLYAWCRGSKKDLESGHSHLAHCIWNLCTLMIYEQKKIGRDDRNPYLLDMLSKKEQKRRIKKWRELANKNKLDYYDGLS